MDILQTVLTKLFEFGTNYGLQIVGAIVILVVGRWVAKALTRAMRKVMAKTKADAILAKFLGTLVYALLLTFVILAALSTLGVNTTSFIAVLGAAGLAVGLAMQGSLSNFGAGVILLLLRPFKVGDFVEAGGATGNVEELSVFSTTLKTLDNKVVIVFNSKITGDIITNYSRMETRRVDFTFGVGYNDDLKKVRKVLMDLIKADQRILEDPAPFVAVGELADNSVNFVVRVWTKTSDYWAVFFDTTELVKLTFDKEGISIPYPQRDLHLVSSKIAALQLSSQDRKSKSLPG